MRFFQYCIPCTPSESGVVISTPSDDNRNHDQLMKQSSMSTSSSLAVGFINPLTLMTKLSAKPLGAETVVSASTAPNTPESTTAIVTTTPTKDLQKVIIVQPVMSMDSMSTTDRPEIYFDEDDEDDISNRTEELNRLKTRLQLHSLDDSVLDSSYDLASQRNDNEVSYLTMDNDDDESETQSEEETLNDSSDYPDTPIRQTKLDFSSRHQYEKQPITDDICDPTEVSVSSSSSIGEQSYVSKSSKGSKVVDRVIARVPSTYVSTPTRYRRRSMIRVVDCDGDEFEDAYNVWYHRGLLLFRPKSIPPPNCVDLEANACDEFKKELESDYSYIQDNETITEAKFASSASDNEDLHRDDDSNAGTGDDNDSVDERAVNATLARNVFGSFRNLNNNIEPTYLHFSDSFDSSSRSESFRKSRSIPIASLFGGDGSNHSRGSITSCTTITQVNRMDGFLFTLPSPEKIVGPVPPSPTDACTIGVPVSRTYQNYLTAYKDHVAIRKAKLGKIV